ncbi:hypothetical protein TrRE_jg1398 [Triparma retinervis]|uniref:Uncharacterized protein n=1 Tax=Triparma retinervis TaxID=2557542 RepID=A0A9W7EB86_9STRA|nr:hypothetical protein TrRE_jg1398 [Triparma retinervis]
MPASSLRVGLRNFTLQFENQVYIKGLEIGINRGSGSVFSIEAYDRDTGTWQQIYQADEITNEQATLDKESNQYNIFKPTICEPSFKTDIIKVKVDTFTVHDWNEFDYAQLTGSHLQSQGVKCDEVVFDEPSIMLLPGFCKLTNLVAGANYCLECPTESTCGNHCSWTGEACEGSMCVSGACRQCGTDQSCDVHEHCHWESDGLSGGTCSDPLVAPTDMNFYDCVAYCDNDFGGGRMGRIPCIGSQEELDQLWSRGGGELVWVGLYQTTENGIEEWIDETLGGKNNKVSRNL